MGQAGIHVHEQFSIMAYCSNNYIAYTCISNTLYNSITFNGYKLALYIYLFNIDLEC